VRWSRLSGFAAIAASLLAIIAIVVTNLVASLHGLPGAPMNASVHAVVCV
jgi:hypothetical protein